jgi:hypothetical protein
LAACFPSPPLFLYDDTDSHTVRVQRSLVSSLLVVWGLSLAYLSASKKKRQREDRAPDAMYGNLYVSGLVGSNSGQSTSHYNINSHNTHTSTSPTT